MSVSGRDRSLELFQLFDAAKARTTPPPASSQYRAPVWPPTTTGFHLRRRPGGSSSHAATSSEETATTNFYATASAFGKDLGATAGMIADLTELLKGQNVFDDQSQEIAQLSSIVTDRLAKLQDDLTVLVEAKKAAVPPKKSRDDDDYASHTDTVIATLRNKLGKIRHSFSAVQRNRSEQAKENCNRASQYTTAKTRSFESALFGGKARSNPTAASTAPTFNGGMEDLEHPVPVRGADGQYPEHRLKLLEDTSTEMTTTVADEEYYAQRREEVHRLETQCIELGTLSHEFNRLVYEQTEELKRIDYTVQRAQRDMDKGTGHLLDFYSRLKTDRGLILKIFGVLFFFLLFFGLVVVR